jgi:hypothetical protein
MPWFGSDSHKPFNSAKCRCASVMRAHLADYEDMEKKLKTSGN